ncbi:CPBP family intramembrane glutamic endopeptidase [Streptococcus plurextorum]|uniref:CPBP family intramembrane glutamic endopeptidase n=1 Tax=Streptococcus plurextorum TaxID=456876 RepID=UPI0004066541|nr:type II CAAX endopeptidase family protein [Streptococcus plurextorum]
MRAENRNAFVFILLYGLLFQLPIELMFGLSVYQVKLLMLAKYLVLGIVGYHLFSASLKQDFGLIKSYKRVFVLHMMACLLGYVLLNALSSGLVSFLMDFFGLGDAPLQNDVNIQTTAQLISPYLFLLFVGIIGPFVEELVFRRAMMGRLKPYFPPVGALIFQALLFALAHVHVLELSQFIQVIPHFVIGLYWGYLYQKTENIYYPMGIHMVTNTLLFCFTFLT